MKEKLVNPLDIIKAENKDAALLLLLGAVCDKLDNLQKTLDITIKVLKDIRDGKANQEPK